MCAITPAQSHTELLYCSPNFRPSRTKFWFYREGHEKFKMWKVWRVEEGRRWRQSWPCGNGILRQLWPRAYQSFLHAVWERFAASWCSVWCPCWSPTTRPLRTYALWPQWRVATRVRAIFCYLCTNLPQNCPPFILILPPCCCVSSTASPPLFPSVFTLFFKKNHPFFKKKEGWPLLRKGRIREWPLFRNGSLVESKQGL